MSEAPRFAFQRVGLLLVSVGGARPPLDAEWEAYLATGTSMLREVGAHERMTGLGFTDGCSPTAPQRALLARMMQGHASATALVSDSITIRATMGMLSFINPALKVFPAREWSKAMAFAGVSEPQRHAVMQVALELGRGLGPVRALGQ